MCMEQQAWMRAASKPLMPLNRDWMDVARYLDGGIHPARKPSGRDSLVAACELQRLQLLAWTSALRGANRAAHTARIQVRNGISEIRAELKRSLELQATVARQRVAAQAESAARHRHAAAARGGKPAVK
jgi:hypothetical protein